MTPANHRILVVDDNRSIHDDFRKILQAQPPSAALTSAEALLFGQIAPAKPLFELTFASQGADAIALLAAACERRQPFAMAFLDIRMPPGIDGIETAGKLWELDPHLQIVICTAHSDYAWSDMANKLGAADRWVTLKKPFDNIEVTQLACALTAKWMAQAEARLERAQLEQRVAERTSDLEAALARLERESGERLQAEQARRALERKLEETQRLESLGVLAGGIAHDFNNILTGVLASASLARLDVPPQSELADHLQRIEDSARRAAELCEQMLAYAGKRKLGTHDLSVTTLIEQTLQLLQASVPRDAELDVDLSPAAPAVHGDAAQIRQVVMNLVINAAEALRTDGPRQLRLRTDVVSLTAEQLAAMLCGDDAKPGEFVMIEVHDTGAGIPPEALGRIFEPFFTTKFTGRGLGLCAVLGIVRSHHGALDVRTELGEGSTFHVYLPAVSVLPPPLQPTAARDETRWQGRGTLLVIDDEPMVRDVAATVLRKKGYSVLTAVDGVEGLAIFRRDPAAIDGVVLDLTMPNMDGIATRQALHALRSDLPILLVSGYSEQDALERFAASGFTGFLHKPFGVEELEQAVATYFPGEGRKVRSR